MCGNYGRHFGALFAVSLNSYRGKINSFAAVLFQAESTGELNMGGVADAGFYHCRKV
jgi:hypothetical protein